MEQVLLLICTMIIVTPFVMGLVIYYNLKRVVKGQDPVSSSEALRTMITNFFKNIFPNKTKSAATENKNTKAENKPVYEDAEFREV